MREGRSAGPRPLLRRCVPLTQRRPALVAVIRRPSLWGTAVGALFGLAPDRWWQRPPFLPIPDREAVDWRMTTAYGSPDTTLDEGDLVAYLEWRRQARRGNGG
jgi:hypothetical protein